jgi:hypothetical protein
VTLDIVRSLWMERTGVSGESVGGSVGIFFLDSLVLVTDGRP